MIKIKRFVWIVPVFMFALTTYGQTQVSGGIFSDETWTLQNAPYEVTDDIVVFPDATLTIEPGVVVKFADGTNMEIQGELLAIGTQDYHITFTSASSAPTSTSWNNIFITYQKRFSFDYVDLSYSMEGLKVGHIGNTSYIRNSNFHDNNTSISLDGGGNFGFSIESTVFQNNKFGVYPWLGDMTLIGCTFDHNELGAVLIESTIDNCLFQSNTSKGLEGHTSIIKNSTFIDNNIGLEQSFSGGSSSSTMTGNTIKNNVIGLLITGNNPQATFTNNTVCENSSYNVKNTSEYSGQDLSHNCWCTTDLNAIEQSIYDARDDLTLGLVTYEPISEVCTPLGLTYENTEDAIQLYPNPVTDRIQLNKTNPINYSIVTLQGVCVEKGVAHGSINASQLPSGAYLIKLEDSEGDIVFKRVIKN